MQNRTNDVETKTGEIERKEVDKRKEAEKTWLTCAEAAVILGKSVNWTYVKLQGLNARYRLDPTSHNGPKRHLYHKEDVLKAKVLMEAPIKRKRTQKAPRSERVALNNRLIDLEQELFRAHKAKDMEVYEALHEQWQRLQEQLERMCGLSPQVLESRWGHKE